METPQEKNPSWLDRPIFTNLTINWETFIFALIVLLGVLSRFYDLEPRVMSHDENSHVYYSWRLAEGQGYQHTPLTHGPLLFHLTAFSYFLFGDNDFTARVPFVIFSIATIGFIWYYRRYLGRVGTLVASGLMLISPYMLYYGRYVRNEALVGLFGVVTIWAILRYLETGEAKYTYWLTAATALHFATKETAFIYTAQALIFLGLVFIYQITKTQTWAYPAYRNAFIWVVILAFALLATAGVASMFTPEAIPVVGEEAIATAPALPLLVLIPAGLSALALLLALYFAILGLTWPVLKQNRSFSLIILVLTLILPHLAAFPVRMMGWDPLNYEWAGMLRTGIFVAILAIIGIAVGLLWDQKTWLINAAIFYIPFTIFYTTIFTNGQGFFTGLVGSLGYWLEQQGVERGSQPWYYYAFLQVPVYEFLPAIGTLIALFFGFRTPKQPDHKTNDEHGLSMYQLTFGLLLFWSITSLIAYTIAGEKMPWLTVHITLPMILLSGWVIGQIIENVNWAHFLRHKGFLMLTLMIILVISFSAAIGSLFGPNPPFQGKELIQLTATNNFFAAFLVTVGSAIGLSFILKDWELKDVGNLGLLTLLGFLALLTGRTAFRAAYINYDNATEYLVYAHSASGPKKALEQIEELSQRTTDGLDLVVAYDDECTYPYWWYLRDYRNVKFYGANPTRELRDAPVILVGDNNFAKIEPVVGQAYHQFDYIRIWWPDQDYYNLTWERIWNTLRDPQMRAAIFQIWHNRDYTQYAALKGKDMSLPNWQPSDRMRLYVRKDIAAQVWNYGSPSVLPEAMMADPYEGKEITLSADILYGTAASLTMPRDVAFAPDGSFYISDTGNHQIKHFSSAGELLHSWGSFADGATTTAPPGTFYEPWGLAVGQDGAVYVADTWNHRIQKFTSAGEFITQWGFFGQGESGAAFWGPRDIVITENGHVLVTDTGNKRVAIFDQDGNYLSQFGSAGLLEGQFDEPVGLALDADGNIYVADTWNQRVQVFQPDASGLGYTPLRAWEIVGWYGQSLDNKPYLSVDAAGNVFVSDPEGYRILQFNNQGDFVQYWGDFGADDFGFNLPTGLYADGDGSLWVVDTGNHRLLHFSVPAATTEQSDT